MGELRKIFEDAEIAIAQQAPINTQQLFMEIRNFAKLAEGVRNSSFGKSLKRIAYLANESSRHITEQGSDSFDKETLRRNTKALNELGKLATKLNEQQDSITKQAHAMYEELGIYLERYYKMN